jgi:hypothetical protein
VVWDVDRNLTTRLLTFIERASVPVPYTLLRDKAISAGYTRREIDQELEKIDKMKGIKARVKDGTLSYTYETPQLRAPQPTLGKYRPTPEETHEWDTLIDNMYRYSPLVSESERVSYIEKHNTRTCTCDGCVHLQRLLWTRDEWTMEERRREREIAKELV